MDVHVRVSGEDDVRIGRIKRDLDDGGLVSVMMKHFVDGALSHLVTKHTVGRGQNHAESIRIDGGGIIGFRKHLDFRSRNNIWMNILVNGKAKAGRAAVPSGAVPAAESYHSAFGQFLQSDGGRVQAKIGPVVPAQLGALAGRTAGPFSAK